MMARPRPLGFMVVLALTFALLQGAGFTAVAEAASEDVAMFYDDLSQHGQWVEYEKYGSVWRPNQVSEDWRPYTNGRWVPTKEGNVFETDEPWGWATYHYGNWMPTESNGWVWVPGRTWYPSTVEWRTSPESEPVDSSYIGWAPTPPPDYVPPPSFAPASYYQGSPVTDALTAPLWIFAKAASFLLGFGQPYAPAYSYINAGVLAPPAYVPVFFRRTEVVPYYAAPTYYPQAFIGAHRLGVGYYNMGPPVPYLARVTRINQTVIINNYPAHINRIHNAVPPPAVVNRHGYMNQIIPPALAQGRPMPPPRMAPNVRMAQVNLNKPNLLPPPQGVPRITAQIPRVQPGARPPGPGLPGTALPRGATMPLTPQMTQQIQKLPAGQRFEPAKAQPFRPTAAAQPGPGQAPPGGKTRPGPAQPGQFQPGAQTRPGQGPPAGRVSPGPVQPGRVQPGAQARPGGAPAGRAQPGEFHPGTGRPGATPGARKPGAAPLPPGHQGLTPEQRRQREQEHQRLQRGGAPGQPQQLQQRQRRSDQERLRQQQLQQRRPQPRPQQMQPQRQRPQPQPQMRQPQAPRQPAPQRPQPRPKPKKEEGRPQ